MVYTYGSIPFSWSEFSEANGYEVEILTVNDEMVFVLNGIEATVANLAIENLNKNNYYKWHVRALKDGSFSPWSETRTFRIEEAPAPPVAPTPPSQQPICYAVANFTAEPQTGEAPLTVILTTTGSSGTLSFDYGDGTSGTENSYTYAEPGSYIVSMTATEGQCQDTAAINITVTAAVSENQPPEKPVLVVDTEGRLTVGEFSDADNDTLDAVVWEVQDGTGILFRLQSDSTVLTLPELFLIPAETYYVTARFVDDKESASEWSEPMAFIAEATYGDENGDGIPDAQEVSDASGIFPELSQDSSCFVYFHSDEGTEIMLGIEKGKNVDDIVAMKTVDPVVFQNPTENPGRMPSGMINFKMIIKPGAVAGVNVHLPVSVPEGTRWYSYDEITNTFLNYDYAVFSENGRMISLEFQDGGFGDRDGVENGIIVVAPSGYSIGGACAFATFSVTPKSGDTPLSVSFDATSSIGLLAWDFGDGSDMDTNPDPVHTYTNPGTYIVTLTAAGNEGCSHTAKQTIEVTSVTESVEDDDDDDNGGGDSSCFISTSANK